jgi:cobalt-zinc-cadmium efflux system membrane fusion protein
MKRINKEKMNNINTKLLHPIITQHLVKVLFNKPLFLSLFFLLLNLLHSGCNNKAAEANIEKENDEAIVVTKSQFENEGMAFGMTGLQTFDKSIEATGIIEAPANASALISSYIQGTITAFSKKPGDQLFKGEAIIEIKSSQFIELQQEFQEATIRLKSSALQLKREQSLQADQITSISNLQAIEAENKSLLTKVNALKAKLLMLQVDPSKIENGNIIPSLWLRSPVNGFLTSINAVIGQFSEPGVPLASAVDVSQMQLKFFLYEKDLSELSDAKKVYFYILDTPDKQFEATIINIGKQIDPQNHKIICYAKPNPQDIKNLPNGAFAKIKVINSDYKAVCLPEEAIIKEGNKNFVISPKSTSTNNPLESLNREGKISLFKIEVSTGETDNGFVEILNPDLSKQWVLTKGGANL